MPSRLAVRHPAGVMHCRARWGLLLICLTGGFAPATILGQSNQASLTVDASQAVRTIDPRLFGLNATIWDNDLTDANTVPDVEAAQIRILRFPGGSLSDGYHWQANLTDNITQYQSTTKPDLDNGPNNWGWSGVSGVSFDVFETSLAEPVGAEVMITVNYGSGTPAEAAAWVKYANVTKGYGVKYWEIGNEEYGTWEIDTNNVPHDPYTYATRAAQYIAQMKAVDPSIKIGVVADAGEDTWSNNTLHPATNPVTGKVHNGWTPVMLTTFKSLGVYPDFLIYHRYPQNPGQETDAGLLQDSESSTGWAYVAGSLRAQLTDYLGAAIGQQIELVCTENNSVSSNVGKQTVSLVNGLYYADSFANLAQTEFNGLCWWALRNGGAATATANFSSSLYGWRIYGDYGVLNLLGSGVPDTVADDQFPVFKVMKLLTHFAGPGDTIVNAASNNTLLSVYAAHRTDGSLSLLIINKSPSATISGSFSLSGFSPPASATEYTYGMAQDNAAEAGSTGLDTDPATATGVPIGSGSFSLSFAPYSATVLSLPEGPTPPAISVQPTAQETVAEGGTASFTVAATGVPAPTYQWYLNNIPVAASSNVTGATDPVLFLANVSAANAGPYTCVATNASGSASSQAGTLSVGAGGPGYLVNISSRAYVGTASGQDLIAGFYTTGPDSKQILVRGVGPTLGTAPFNVPGVLTTPFLTLYDVNQNVLQTNGTWGGTAALQQAFQNTGAFSLPANSADTALIQSVTSGGYTAAVSGQGNIGIALAEIYDDQLAAAPTDRLINISSRADVGTGADTLIDGFVIAGSNAETVLLRAVGPTLANFSLTGVLSSPVLTLYNSSDAVIATNSGWNGDATLATVFSRVGAFSLPGNPSPSADAAMLITLPPGLYTVQVSGANATTGIALAEVYEVR